MAFARALFVSLLLAGSSLAGTIRVGAAISLKDALESIAKSYEQRTGEHVDLVFGASGQILAQIKNGGAIDVFVSAANEQVDALQKAGLVDAASRRVVVSNELVLVAPPNATQAPKDFAALADGQGKIAVGEPKTVPAGQYAKQVFDKLNLSAALKDRLVYGTNVRQVLAYVERGEVAAGVVYATDAKQAGDKVKLVAAAPPDSHEPIVYPGVVVNATADKAAALKFLDALAGEQAKAVLLDKGFSVPLPPVAGPGGM